MPATNTVATFYQQELATGLTEIQDAELDFAPYTHNYRITCNELFEGRPGNTPIMHLIESSPLHTILTDTTLNLALKLNSGELTPDQFANALHAQLKQVPGYFEHGDNYLAQFSSGFNVKNLESLGVDYESAETIARVLHNNRLILASRYERADDETRPEQIQTLLSLVNQCGGPFYTGFYHLLTDTITKADSNTTFVKALLRRVEDELTIMVSTLYQFLPSKIADVNPRSKNPILMTKEDVLRTLDSSGFRVANRPWNTKRMTQSFEEIAKDDHRLAVAKAYPGAMQTLLRIDCAQDRLRHLDSIMPQIIKKLVH